MTNAERPKGESINNIKTKIMSILDGVEETLKKGDEIVHLMEEIEEVIFDLLAPGVGILITDNINLPEILKVALEKAMFQLLSKYKNRKVISLDCKGLMKGEAEGWMKLLAEQAKENPDLIVLIENITEIPSGPQCDDPQYVENLLGHSWKNEQIYFGDYHLDRSEMTVILIASLENKEKLAREYRTDSYAWIEDFDERLSALKQAIEVRI